MIDIRVKGVKLDNDKKDNTVDLTLQIPKETFENMNKDDIENFIEDEISNKTGYCHFGWESYEF